MRRSEVFLACLGTCAELLPSICPDPGDWTPSDSKYLAYSGSVRPFAGVDGSYVINLKRRDDRLAGFWARSGLAPQRVHVFEAFNGVELSWSSGLTTLFGTNLFNDARGIIGCALSHFALWRHIAETADEVHIIFEDDAVFADGFDDAWRTRYSYALPAAFDVTFLGGVLPSNRASHAEATEPWNKLFATHKETNFFNHIRAPGEEGNAHQNTTAFHYEAVGYALTSAGAKKLVQFVVQNGFTMSVDMMLMRYMREGGSAVYVATPPLVNGPDPAPELVYGGDADAKGDTVPVPRTDGV